MQAGVVDGDLGDGFVADVESGEVLLVGVVEGLLGEDAILLHLERAMVGVLEHGEVGGFGGYLVIGDGGGGRVSGGDGGRELGLLGCDLVEDLFLIELRQDFALVDGLIDVGIELGDDAAGLGFHFDFGDGLDLAGCNDGAGDVADLDGAELGGIDGGAPPRVLAATNPPPTSTQTTIARMIQSRRRDLDFALRDEFKGPPKPLRFALRSEVTQFWAGWFPWGENGGI